MEGSVRVLRTYGEGDLLHSRSARYKSEYWSSEADFCGRYVHAVCVKTRFFIQTRDIGRSLVNIDRSLLEMAIHRPLLTIGRSLLSVDRCLPNMLGQHRSMFAKHRSIFTFAKRRSMFAKHRSIFTKHRLLNIGRLLNLNIDLSLLNIVC